MYGCLCASFFVNDFYYIDKDYYKIVIRGLKDKGKAI